ncbi:predicted protein [Culex quinquefasciatus]|uniref:Predicted protein n=1 Tax=Culex quinquefasciatus TaxID=7176 RepID=B0WJ78_CULQU|nr:uncharacterized protein LOC6039093 [Culex quinquefasciatus]EDS29003.1 predicted protein [Culex quinquefasciatus]|eukprot:XP_001848762.1 predicted protein [Culex quinquefasciatus]
MTVASKHINDLPTEVIWHILDQLPVRERIRLSVVCKRWDEIVLRSSSIVFMPHTNSNQLSRLLKTINQSNRMYRRVALTSMIKHDEKEFGELCLAAARKFGKSLQYLVINGIDLRKSTLLQVLNSCGNLKELILDVRIVQTERDSRKMTVAEFPVLPHLQHISFATYYNISPFYECFQSSELVPSLTSLKFRGVYLKAIPFLENLAKQLTFLVVECDHRETLQALFKLRPLQLKYFALTVKYTILDDRLDDVVPFFAALANLEKVSIASKMEPQLGECLYQTIYDTCAKLETLRLVNPENNPVLVVNKDLQKLSRLQCLELSGNNRKPAVLMPSLERLRIEFSTTGVEYYREIQSAMPNLTVLEIFEDDRFTDRCLEEVCSTVPNIKKLVLFNCKNISSTAFAHLCKLHKLRVFELIYNSVENRVMFEFFRQFPPVPNRLDRFLIAGNVRIRLTNVVHILDSMPNLKVLEIASSIHVPAPRRPKTKTEIIFSKPYQKSYSRCRMLREINRL